MNKKNLEIQFINHASYIVRHQASGVALWVDPWFRGSAFNHGWDFLAQMPSDATIWKEISHIWLSHEHPDHFSPPILKSIDEAVRNSITVLFRHTRDKRIIDFCKQLGFQMVELEDYEIYQLSKDITLRTAVNNRNTIDSIDSFSLLEMQGT